MKVLLLLLLLVLSVLAKANESCYTVQLVSQYSSQKNLNLLNSKSYPASCKLMEIGKSLTVRCGCFEVYSEAQEALESYKKAYTIAVIARTYKYRFESSLVEKSILKKVTRQERKSPRRSAKALSQKDEELRLMLQVFLYKSDLKNAYKVATLGYKKHPNSYYWNQKMAEISKWTNRSARSMKHLRLMYDIHRDPKIEKELIEYGARAYQYEEIEPLVVNRAKAHPSEKNIDLMITVFKKIGSPEKVVAVLDEEYEKDHNNTMLLTKALALSLEMGDLDLAAIYVKKIEINKPYSKKDAALLSRYYYVRHNIPKAYESLAYIQKRDKDDEDEADHVKYYELKSDLGWYLQDNKAAALASKYLMDMNKSRLVDYERISFVHQKSHPKLALFATKRAYEEHKLSYLFYSYANGAINSKNYDELNDLLYSIEKSSTPLLREALYWIVKAKVCGHYNEYVLEQEALYMAEAMEPDNFQIKLELLWLYLDLHDNKNLQKLLFVMSEKLDLDSSYYLPMASAYLYLGDINRASYYTKKLLANEDPITKIVEFQFLQAYIYQIQNNEGGFRTYMHKIVAKLQADAKENPKLKKQDRYLFNYLQAAMFTLSPDKFEKRLKKAKKYLSEKNYREIAYSWAMQNSADEKSLRIYHKMHKKELWIKFHKAMIFQNHTEIENMLDIYLHSLSMGDASQMAEKDGQIALAQTITFEGLLKNEKNQNAYVHHLDLSKQRSDKFSSKFSYYDRNPLLQKYVELKNQTYLQDAYTLLSKLRYYNSETIDTRYLLRVPKSMGYASLGIKRGYNRGYIHGSVAYHSGMREYLEYGFNANYRMSSDLYGGVQFTKNEDALESTELFIGGKKDKIALDVRWTFLNSTELSFHGEYNVYTSQDAVNLGSGYYTRVSLIKTIKNGYPDLKLGLFYDRGIYDETEGSRGVIDALQTEPSFVLPNTFYNVGVSIDYGLANSSPYTRVWRPYVQFYPHYNSEIDAYVYGVDVGYGGKIWHQDHLVFGLSYTERVNGRGKSVLELFMNYQFMYYHP